MIRLYCFIVCIFYFVFIFSESSSGPFPIQFAISSCKIIDNFPAKNRDFAFIIPGMLNTYIYNDESDYYQGYQQAYFAITCQKGGWDCLRHYEILANGCIPYFIDIDKCPPKTMSFFPKELVLEAMNLEGVSFLRIDHNRFDSKRYYEILAKLMDYTRQYLTTSSMGKYLLNTLNYKTGGKILYLSTDIAPDYMRSCMLIGLKEILGEQVIDVPKIDHIYKSYSGNTKNLYGKGFTYTKIVDDVFIDRENIEERIKNREFSLIIYSTVHKFFPFYDLVSKVYAPAEIAYICGEDMHNCECIFLKNLFLREF